MKYITPDGAEHNLDSIKDCAAAIRAGTLTTRTMIFDETPNRWIAAGEHPDVAALLGTNANTQSAYKQPRWIAPSSWIGWILAFLLPPSIASYLGQNFAYALGETISAVLIAMLIGAAVRAFAKSRVRRAQAIPGAAILALTLALYLVVPEALKHATDRRALATSAKALTQTIDSVGQGTPPVAPTTNPPATEKTTADVQDPTPVNTARSKSEAAAMLMDIVREAFDEQKQMRQYQVSSTNALMPDTLLAPDTLTNESKLRASDARIATYESALDRYDQMTKAWVDGFDAKIKALPIADAEKEEFRSSFRAGASKSEHMVSEFLESERAMLKEVKALHSFAADRIGTITVKNNTMLFVTNADVDFYNGQMSRISKLADRESRILAQAEKAAADGKAQVKAAAAQFLDTNQ